MVIKYLFLLLVFRVCQTQILIENLRADMDSPSKTIIVRWDFRENRNGITFVLRHRLHAGGYSRNPPPWHTVRLDGAQNEYRIEMGEMRTGDEIEVQIKVERRGQTIEDWSQQLLINAGQRTLVEGRSITDEAGLEPPLEFTAEIPKDRPTSVKLQWLPPLSAPPGIHYVVDVRQLTAHDGTHMLNQQLKVYPPAHYFTLEELMQGERYSFTIHSALGDHQMSRASTTVEITMPVDRTVDVGSLLISSAFEGDGSGSVRLTWTIPREMEGKIHSYNVQYTEAGREQWKAVQFSGIKPTATLTDLRPDTEYQLKIKTMTSDGSEVESGQLYTFKTPKLEDNPIDKVDVIFGPEQNEVRLQWILDPSVDTAPIVGYDVYITENKDLPERQWQLTRLDSREASLPLRGLRVGGTYYVKVNVRNRDGSVLRGRSMFRFRNTGVVVGQNGGGRQTPQQLPAPGATPWRPGTAGYTYEEYRESNSLEYRNLGNGKVSITWSYPSRYKDQLTGAMIMYTRDKRQPMDQWMKVLVSDPGQRSVVLDRLAPGTVYYVRIMPKLKDDGYDSTAGESFTIRTDQENQHQEFPFLPPSARRQAVRSDLPLPMDDDDDDGNRTSARELRLSPCNSGSPRTVGGGKLLLAGECGPGERCVPTTRGSEAGWCVPTTLWIAVKQAE